VIRPVIVSFMGLYRRSESAVWWMSYTLNGTQHRVSSGTVDKEQAKRQLSERITFKKAPDKRSVSALLDNLIANYRINGQSVEWCEQYVEVHLRPAFGHLKAEQLTYEDLVDFVNSKTAPGALSETKGYSNATVNRGIALLKRAFNLARIPFPKIQKLKENNVRKGFVDEEQFFALSERLPVHQRPLALFAFETGCRKGEILSLKWSQIDFIRNMVRLNPNETKNKEGRVIPLSRMMMWFLKTKVPRCSEFVFTYKGKRLRDIRTGWDEAQEGAKVKVLFHDLRRSAIRNMVRAGVPERVAMAVSGHKTRSVFDRYNVVDEQDLSAAMETLTKNRSHFSVATPDLTEYDASQRKNAPAVETESVLTTVKTIEIGLDRDLVNQVMKHRLPPRKSKVRKARRPK
jgi:integrase